MTLKVDTCNLEREYMSEETNGQFGATPNIEVIIGAAGTGKTHKIIQIIEDLEKQDKEYFVVAFTNRAAKVLRDRGIKCASTIHKTLYESRKKDPEEFKEVMIPVIDPTTRFPMRDERGQIMYGIEEEPVWVFGFKHDAFDASQTLIIDEASLIPSKIWGNIFDYWPGNIIIVGDHNQLPPVEMDEENRDERYVGFFHMAAQYPTVDLGGNQNNRRVAGEGQDRILPAIYEHIYDKANPQGLFPPVDFDGVYSYRDLTKNTLLNPDILVELESADIVVTWKNDECKFINDMIRERRAKNAGIKYSPYPRAGDKILAKRHFYKVTKEDKEYWDKEEQCMKYYVKETKEQLVTSGDEYTIESITNPDSKNNVIWVLLEGVRNAVPLSIAHIDGGRANRALEPVTWDYAYAITCHKAQGSGWAKVVIVDSYCMPKDAQRWRYTAATRASEQVVVIRSGISFDKRTIVGERVEIGSEIEAPQELSENRKRLREMIGRKTPIIIFEKKYVSDEILAKYRVK